MPLLCAQGWHYHAYNIQSSKYYSEMLSCNFIYTCKYLRQVFNNEGMFTIVYLKILCHDKLVYYKFVSLMSESIPYFLLRSDLNHMKQKDHVLLSK